VSWFVYIVECSDKTLYTGVTDDLENRVRKHNAKMGARYTKTRTPVVLRYTEEFRTKGEAISRERQLKGWPHAKKMALIDVDSQDLKKLSQHRP
jgi:putative endonuclease